jgi:hypothetical protein
MCMRIILQDICVAHDGKTYVYKCAYTAEYSFHSIVLNIYVYMYACTYGLFPGVLMNVF